MGKRKSKMYKASHSILLVGEGDFSFSLSLARRFGSAANMVATSLDSWDELLSKYSKAAENLGELEEFGCTILHEINVHKMSKIACFRNVVFDRIVFNFPHAGFFYPENDTRQIRLNKVLMRGFLRNAKKMLDDNGQIFITHKTNYPYDQWEIEELAEEAGLEALSEVPFHRNDYPGYVNKRGFGAKCNRTFPAQPSSTFRFEMSEESDDFDISRLFIRGTNVKPKCNLLFYQFYL